MATITIPDPLHAQLAATAAARKMTLGDLAAEMLADHLPRGRSARRDIVIDHAYHEACAADTSPVPTLAEVRANLSKLPGSLTADVIAGREARVGIIVGRDAVLAAAAAG